MPAHACYTIYGNGHCMYIHIPYVQAVKFYTALCRRRERQCAFLNAMHATESHANDVTCLRATAFCSKPPVNSAQQGICMHGVNWPYFRVHAERIIFAVRKRRHIYIT